MLKRVDHFVPGPVQPSDDDETVWPLGPGRLARVTVALSCARVPESAMRTLLQGDYRPLAGDLLLARVASCRGVDMFIGVGGPTPIRSGDELLLCYGAADSRSPRDRRQARRLVPCVLLNPCGFVSDLATIPHDRDALTMLEPLGLVGSARGEVLNVGRFEPRQRSSEVA